MIGFFICFGLSLMAVPKTDWQKEGLQGKVKSVTTEYGITRYNQQGYVTSITYGGEDSFSGDVVYSYDSGNRMLVRISRNPYHEESERITNTYDATGLLLKTVRNGDYEGGVDKAEYNSKKQLIWLKTYDAELLIQAVEYIYDAAGNKTRENNYNEDMEIYSFIEFDYDDDGKLMEKRDFDNFIPDTPETVLKYNPRGWLIEEIAFYAGRFDYQKRYSYDTKGNLIKEETNYGEGDFIETYTCTYTYDKQGNWISKSESSAGELLEKQERVITYY